MFFERTLKMAKKQKLTGHIKIDPNRDSKLIAKLRAINAINPYTLLKLNTLARTLLDQKLDELITKHGITVDYQRPASVAG